MRRTVLSMSSVWCTQQLLRALNTVLLLETLLYSFFISEFVEFERVFVVCVGLQFQHRLGGVFHERFTSLDAVVGQTVFIISVDSMIVRRPIVVG